MLSGAEGLPQRTGALPVKRSTSSPELAIHNVVTIFLSLWGSRESLALGSTSLPSLEENTSPTKKYLLPSWSQLNTHRATHLLLRRKSNSHSWGTWSKIRRQKKKKILAPCFWSLIDLRKTGTGMQDSHGMAIPVLRIGVRGFEAGIVTAQIKRGEKRLC